MRDILFRGKRKDNGEWVQAGNIIHFNDEGIEQHYYIPKYNETCVCTHDESDNIICVDKGTFYKVIPETVGQYTGLTDKNGTKIFEGDIVKFAKHLYQIIFECGSFVLLDKQGKMISKIGGINDHCYSLMNLYLECCWKYDCAFDVEIIGNIHDNPELLGGIEE